MSAVFDSRSSANANDEAGEQSCEDSSRHDEPVIFDPHRLSSIRVLSSKVP